MRTPMAIHFIEESEIVSSILKALKKLEDDNPPKGRSVIWPSGRAPRRTIRRWDISSGWSVLLLWGMLAVVLLISVGGLLLYLLSPAKHDGMPAASVAQLVTKPIQESPPPEAVARSCRRTAAATAGSPAPASGAAADSRGGKACATAGRQENSRRNPPGSAAGIRGRTRTRSIRGHRLAGPDHRLEASGDIMGALARPPLSGHQR
jgi:hypothetical protein